MKKNFATFDELIAPISPERFFAEFWEKRFLHLEKGPGTFDHLFSTRDVDRWLMSTRGGPADSVAITSPAGSGSLFQKSRPLDVAIDAAYQAFADGRSIVLNYLENCWPPLSGLVTMLGAYFCAEVGANVYLTPPGKRTFPVHVDDHDAFILQVDGVKRWQLHEQRFLSVMRLVHKEHLEFPAEWGQSRLETPLAAELELRPGDLLYIPRGMPHCAVAGEATSLHLTISVMPLYWTDFLKAAVEQAALEAPELRRAFPAQFVNNPEAREAMRASFDQAMQAFADRASYDTTFQVLCRNRVRQQGFPRDGHFADLDPVRPVAPSSVLLLRPGLLCLVETGPGFSSLRFATRHVRGPEHLLRAFEFIRDHERFRVAEIPGLDEQGQQVLARRLIREGLLCFAELRDGFA
jgi:ribosomal protein L16 Arg81 hydroxylase